MYRATVRVAPEDFIMFVREEKSCMAVERPTVYMSTALSPTTRPTARMHPVTMPSMEEGSTTVRIMCHFPLPRPSAPSR